jgi:Protein of unknown function (DUF1570)
MKRWLLAAGGLIGALLCTARAEYIRITYTLSPNKSVTETAAAAAETPGEDGEGPGRRRRAAPRPQQPPPQVKPQNGITVDKTTIKADAVVEYKSYVMKAFLTGTHSARRFPVIRHKWGQTAMIPNSDITLTAIQEKGIALPPVSKRYAMKKKELLKGVKLEDQADKWIELGKWALAHGMTDEIPNVMDNVVKTKSKDPAIVSILTAYQTMDAAMKKRVDKDEAVFSRWREKFGSNLRAYHDPYSPSPASGHYTAIYRSESLDPTEVKSFIARLEEHYRGFFYWFALRGTILKVPDYRLIVLMTDNPDQFHFLKQVFDNPVQVEDGFCSRRGNLLVCSSVRLDSTYKALNQATQSLWLSGWSKERLLQGVGRDTATPEENARNQILALVMQAMQEESNIATITNLGTEQLLTATDLIPHGVVAPEWFLFGCCSYFETPKGAYWPGIGAPSWRYLAKWKTLEEPKNRLLPSPEAMRLVVSDEMFQRALQSKNEEDILVARTYSWALVYFLEEVHHEELVRYFTAMRGLPRDLQFDPNTLVMTFATSFDLLAAMNRSEIDEVKWAKLAREWYDFLHYTNFEASEAYIDAVKDFGWGDPGKPLDSSPQLRYGRPRD